MAGIGSTALATPLVALLLLGLFAVERALQRRESRRLAERTSSPGVVIDLRTPDARPARSATRDPRAAAGDLSERAAS